MYNLFRPIEDDLLGSIPTLMRGKLRREDAFPDEVPALGDDTQGADMGGDMGIRPDDTAALPGNNPDWLRRGTDMPEPQLAGAGLPQVSGLQPAAPPTDTRDRLMRSGPVDEEAYKSPLTMPERDSSQVYSDIEKTRTDSGQREHSAGKRFLSGMAKGWQNSEGGLFGAAVHALFGGASSAASPKAHEALGRRDRRGELMRELGDVQKREDFVSNENDQAARTHTIAVDDANRSRQLQEIERRNGEQERQKSLKTISDHFWKAEKHYDPNNITEFQRRVLAQGGFQPEDIASFDFRNPKTVAINGITYERGVNGDYEQTNLPESEKDKLVEHTVTDLDGKKHVFKVPQSKSAEFIESANRAQMMATAAAARQDDQQSYQLGRDEQERKFRKEMSGIQDEQQAVTKLTSEMAEGRRRVGKGELNEEQYDKGIRDLIQMFPESVRAKLLERYQSGKTK